MNAIEEQVELGSMVQERREVKSRLACTKNKLNRYRVTLQQTAFSMEFNTIDGFRFSDSSDEFTVLSVVAKSFEKDRPFPSREELAKVLKDYISLENRLAELEDLLS